MNSCNSEFNTQTWDNVFLHWILLNKECRKASLALTFRLYSNKLFSGNHRNGCIQQVVVFESTRLNKKMFQFLIKNWGFDYSKPSKIPILKIFLSIQEHYSRKLLVGGLPLALDFTNGILFIFFLINTPFCLKTLDGPKNQKRYKSFSKLNFKLLHISGFILPTGISIGDIVSKWLFWRSLSFIKFNFVC